MAIDKDTMMQTVYGGQGLVAGSPIPPGMPGHQGDIGLKYDVAAAKTELAQALTELGVADVSEAPAAVVRLQHQRRPRAACCVHAGPVAPEPRCPEPPSSARPSTSSSPTGLPASSRSLVTHGARTIRTRTTSCGRCSAADRQQRREVLNKAFDDLDRPGRRRDRLAKSIALYNQAQSLLVEDAPAVFTRWRVANYEIAPYVTGITGTVQDSVFYGDTFPETIAIVQH